MFFSMKTKFLHVIFFLIKKMGNSYMLLEMITSIISVKFNAKNIFCFVRAALWSVISLSKVTRFRLFGN
jgi:hypothetical protein